MQGKEEIAIKYRYVNFDCPVIDFNINDYHLMILKEIQWFSMIKSEFFKDWKRRICRKEEIAVKYRLCEF